MRKADPPEVRERRLVELRLAAEAALRSLGTMDLLDIMGRTEEAQPEMNVITPASLRMFSSGPDGFLWRCADAWEEDVSDVCTINAELNTIIIRQQKRIKALERDLRWVMDFAKGQEPWDDDEKVARFNQIEAALEEAHHDGPR